MSALWIPRIASSIDAEEARVRAVDWPEAQSWCNFVLMRPADFPRDLALEKTEIRPESPPGRARNLNDGHRPEWTQSNRAAHRSEFVGRERRLRIKQFLYDYAPPAFDHPCLWESEGIRGFPVGDHIGWLGTDFRKLQAATVCFDRTTIELSVTAGTFSDEELEAVCRGLTPAVAEARRQILQTPLADLSYQSRHEEPPIGVPVGYWAHKRPESLRVTVLHAEDIPALRLPVADIAPPDDYGYRLNTAFVFGEPARPQEVDLVFEQTEDAGRYLRLLVSEQDAANGLPFPPALEKRHPSSSHLLRVNESDVYHAYHDERYGQHEAVWQKQGLTMMLIVKPAVWTDMAWFINLLNKMV
ncbi:MAG: hypothetical protein WCF57_24085 [Pyrinomonadaceae bacterium]